jgi:hypothetical protein
MVIPLWVGRPKFDSRHEQNVFYQLFRPSGQGISYLMGVKAKVVEA